MQPLSSPASIVLHGLQLALAGEWDEFVELVDHDSLGEWLVNFVEANTIAPALEELRRRYPDVPAARLTTIHEQLSIHPARFVASLSSHFAGVETLEQLDALSPQAAFLRYLEAQDSFVRMSRLRTAAYAHADLPVPTEPPFERPRADFVVEREESLNAVDVRVAFSDAGEPPVVGEWIARRQSDGSWRLVATHQLCTPPGVQVWIFDDPIVLDYIRPRMDSDTPAV